MCSTFATTAALIWAAPGAWGIVLALSAVTLLLPLVAQKVFREPDMNVQSQTGALSKFILDALVGLTPILIHGAGRSLRRSQFSSQSFMVTGELCGLRQRLR